MHNTVFESSEKLRVIKTFSIYNSETHKYINAIDEQIQFKSAFECFKENFLKVFDPAEYVVFILYYNDEAFSIHCLASDFILNIDHIEDFDNSCIVISNENQTKYLSLYKGEYDYDVGMDTFDSQN